MTTEHCRWKSMGLCWLLDHPSISSILERCTIILRSFLLCFILSIHAKRYNVQTRTEPKPLKTCWHRESAPTIGNQCKQRAQRYHPPGSTMKNKPQNMTQTLAYTLSFEMPALPKFPEFQGEYLTSPGHQRRGKLGQWLWQRIPKYPYRYC